MTEKQQAYVLDEVAQDWTPNVIVGHAEMAIDCSIRTLYRLFKNQVFHEATLLMKGKRKPNGHQ